LWSTAAAAAAAAEAATTEQRAPLEAIGDNNNTIHRLSSRNCVDYRLSAEKGVGQDRVAVDSVAHGDELHVVDEQHLDARREQKREAAKTSSIEWCGCMLDGNRRGRYRERRCTRR
jgi:hypothetical protein